MSRDQVPGHDRGPGPWTWLGSWSPDRSLAARWRGIKGLRLSKNVFRSCKWKSRSRQKLNQRGEDEETGLRTVLATALLAAGAATAIATPGSVLGNSSAKKSAGATMGSVSVRFKINKFVKRGHRLIAKGAAIATYTPQSGGTPTIVKKPFSARVGVAGRLFSASGQKTICPVLTLQLDQLSLDLLGLHLDLSKVVLTITADSQGGILGRLFCSLSSGKVKLATMSHAQKLTKAAHSSGLSTKGIGFAVPASQMQAMAPGPCS